MRWFDCDVEIRYADTDQMGIVHHSVFPLYCEIGRTRLCEDAGLPYHEMERAGFFLMVADMQCRYRAPARYGEPIYVRTTIAKLGRRLIVFDYEIRSRNEDALLFTGSTKHVVTQGLAGQVSMPPDYMEKLERARRTD